MNRRLLLNLRRLVRVSRRFDVDYPGEGTRLGYRCRTCGVRTEIAMPTTERMAAKLASYQAQGGVSGSCATCLRHERDAKYPLK